MNQNRHHLLVLLALSVLIFGVSCAPLSAISPAAAPTPDEVELRIVELVNEERDALELEPFVLNDQLMWMAQVRSDDMVASDYAGHNPPEGHPTLYGLTENLGYNSAQSPVENIALVPITDGNLDSVAERAIIAWRNSPGHWHWITSHHYWITGVGVAVADDHVIVTQLFWGAGGSTPPDSLRHNRKAAREP